MAWREVEEKGCTQPRTSDSAKRSSIVIEPANVRPAKAMAWASDKTCAIFCWLEGSVRSVTAPAKSASTSMGARSAAAMMPSQVGEWVSSQASQPTPTRCIQTVTRPGVMPPMKRA